MKRKRRQFLSWIINKMDDQSQRLNENLWFFYFKKYLLSYKSIYFPHKQGWRTSKIQNIVFIKSANTTFRNHMENN